MFQNERYITRGVQSEIPIELQIFMWSCVNALPEPRDYLQVFRLFSFEGKQKIVHEQEKPEYKKEYILKAEATVTAKVYVIDDGDHSTMLLAEEY